jgi:uncharacterized membrane protein YgcG
MASHNYPQRVKAQGVRKNKGAAHKRNAKPKARSKTRSKAKSKANSSSSMSKSMSREEQKSFKYAHGRRLRQLLASADRRIMAQVFGLCRVCNRAMYAHAQDHAKLAAPEWNVLPELGHWQTGGRMCRACSAQYHGECLQSWLMRHNRCAMCNRESTTAVGKTGRQLFRHVNHASADFERFAAAYNDSFGHPFLASTQNAAWLAKLSKRLQHDFVRRGGLHDLQHERRGHHERVSAEAQVNQFVEQTVKNAAEIYHPSGSDSIRIGMDSRGRGGGGSGGGGSGTSYGGGGDVVDLTDMMDDDELSGGSFRVHRRRRGYSRTRVPVRRRRSYSKSRRTVRRRRSYSESRRTVRRRPFVNLHTRSKHAPRR